MTIDVVGGAVGVVGVVGIVAVAVVVTLGNFLLPHLRGKDC